MLVGVEALEECILVMWLRDSGRTAAFTKAIRAIIATTNGELMLDKPRGIYENPSSVKEARSTTGDIWDGSILLNLRIELFTMVIDASIKYSHTKMYELARLYPTFMDEERYLDVLYRRLLPLDHYSLSSFLTVYRLFK
jgi:hypothetical protein